MGHLVLGPDALLRALRPGDADELALAANDREIWRNLRDGFPRPYTRADAERWISYNEQLGLPLNFAIVHDEHVVGGVGLVPGHDVHRHSAEIGYWLARAVWGRGLATRAVGAMVRHGFDTLGFVRLHAGVFAWNPASARVLEKNEFVLEGTMRKWALKDGHYVDAWAYARVRD